ncbi:MAG: DUF4147 domain-containing protein [Candidatus Paceibacterota bacterium]|jgi:glycerate-2-kinase
MERVIRNSETLATNKIRLDALSIAEAGYAALNTGAALVRDLTIDGDRLRFKDMTYELAGRRVFFIGVGKCSFAAAEAVERILGERLTGGIALDVSSPDTLHVQTIEAYAGTHPLPSEANERATKRILTLLSACREDDLVLMLISGGGSTLLCQTEAPMDCETESAFFTELTLQGATIQDINTVRKHTSPARGGGLAKAAYPAEVLSLLVSDVPGDDLAYIASGPTVRDDSTVADAEHVLARYGIDTAVKLIETPKEEKYFERVTNVLFLANRNALTAMQAEAGARGYAATIMDDRFTGDADTLGRSITETLHTMPPKTVLLYAGESTVTLPTRHGAGGRNQEMALAALPHVREDELVLPLASDGHDNTAHAGAIADTATRMHAQTCGASIEEYLAQHRSYDFFETTGDAVVTGYTGCNVSDIIIAIKE